MAERRPEALHGLSPDELRGLSPDTPRAPSHDTLRGHPHDTLRVMSIAHTAVSRVAGRLRYNKLREDRSLQVRLIVPRRWHQFGRWLEAEPAQPGDVETRALPIRLPRAGPASWHLHFYGRLLGEVRAFRPDVLHVWEEPWSLVALQASMLARWCGCALVLEVDQNILKRLPPPFEAIRRFVLRRTDLLLSRTREAYGVARACGFTGPNFDIGYGVDESVFFPAPRRAPAPGLHVGYVGRLVAEKGVDDLLDALAAAPAGTRATILGEGAHGARLRSRARALGLAERVVFRPWGTPDQVAELLREIDVLALVTRTTADVREQFGRVIIEAQACGTPVIGSTSGAIPAIIGDGGWIVPERDPAAIMAVLAHLHRDPAELAAKRAIGLANVAERFTHAGVAEQLRTAWRQAVLIRDARAHKPIGRGKASATGFSQP